MLITGLINRVGFMSIDNLIEKLSMLSQYVMGAHHATNDETISVLLHGVNHRIEEAINDAKVLASNHGAAVKPNVLYRDANGFQRGIEVPVETNPSRE
jgi:hypothetical protein